MADEEAEDKKVDAPEDVAAEAPAESVEAAAENAGEKEADSEIASDSTDGNQSDANIPIQFDKNLLDLMVGELGSPAILEEKCQQIMLSLAQVFMVLFKEKNMLPIEATSGEVSHGTRSELLKKIEGDFCYCESQIETWSKDIAIFCNNDLVISMVECLLGGDDPDNITVTSRPLSDLELELSRVFFEVVNEALKATITRNPTLEQSVEKPKSFVPDVEDETYKEYHAIQFSINLVFGKLETSVSVIVPQSRIIKTDIEAINSRRRKPEKKSEWAEKLSKQVYNSDIGLQANINLERLKLNEVGRLQVGDVLRFGDEGDPTVILQANGRELYNCTLGKSGNRYMVRVEEPFGDEDWKEGF